MNLNLEAKVVVISGATGGIGSEISKKFLESGCNVALLARNAEKLSLLSEKLSKDYGAEKVRAVLTDCSDSESVSNSISKILDEWSEIDVAVANVGSGKSESKSIPSSNSFKDAFDTNFKAAENLCRSTETHLRKSNGNLLFISSIAGIEINGAPTDYSVAKAAVIMLAKQLSHKLAPEIRVNCISPGNIYFAGGRWDELLKSDPEAVNAMIQNLVPLKKFGKPSDIANAALFLCSPQAGFITGANITIDGGQSVSVN